MSLSITNKLTITSAALTGLILLPASILLYLSFAGSISRERGNQAVLQAGHIARTLVQHMNEEILIEFESKTVSFKEANVAFKDWAVVRGDGRPLHLSGAFAEGTLSGAENAEAMVEAGNGEIYRIASALLTDRTRRYLMLQDLPAQVRSQVSRVCPGPAFLSAKAITAKDGGVFEVRWVASDHIVEMKLGPDGRIIDSEPDPLPTALPQHFLSWIECPCKPVSDVHLSWLPYNRQLVAVLKGSNAQGEPVQVAVNQLGERFDFDEEGHLSDPIQGSQLYVVTAMDASGELAERGTVMAVLGIGTPLLWLAFVLAGWFVARRAMAPVEKIVETVTRIKLPNLDERLPVGRANDELDRIASTINGMLDRIMNAYVRERQFTADASHELRGPLTKVIADIDLALSRERNVDEHNETLLRLRNYATGMQQLVESLLFLARLDAGTSELEMTAFDVCSTAVDVINRFPKDAAGRIGFDIEDGGKPLEALGEPRLVGIMMHNLLENAIRYSPDDRQVRMEMHAENGCIAVRIEDEGQGIPERHAAEVFDRFYRLDKSRARETGGIGLGLAIVKEIARVHQTRVEFEGGARGGTVARFSLPEAHRDS